MCVEGVRVPSLHPLRHSSPCHMLTASMFLHPLQNQGPITHLWRGRRRRVAPPLKSLSYAHSIKVPSPPPKPRPRHPPVARAPPPRRSTTSAATSPVGVTPTSTYCFSRRRMASSWSASKQVASSTPCTSGERGGSSSSSHGLARTQQGAGRCRGSRLRASGQSAGAAAPDFGRKLTQKAACGARLLCKRYPKAQLVTTHSTNAKGAGYRTTGPTPTGLRLLPHLAARPDGDVAQHVGGAGGQHSHDALQKPAGNTNQISVSASLW
jgi:hypothetical protein